MEYQALTTETRDAEETRAQFGELLDRVARGRTRVIVERDGKPVAVIVSMTDLKQLQRDDERRAERNRVVAEFRAAFADTPPEELEREVAKALAEVRAEMWPAAEPAVSRS